MERTYSQMKAWVREHCGVTKDEQVKPYSMIEVTDDDGNVGIGFSKCGPHDTWNAVRGLEIAKGRAIAAIARALMTENERVNCKCELVPVSGEQHDFVDDLSLTERNLL
jgi:hypothetical protein